MDANVFAERPKMWSEWAWERRWARHVLNDEVGIRAADHARFKGFAVPSPQLHHLGPGP